LRSTLFDPPWLDHIGTHTDKPTNEHCRHNALCDPSPWLDCFLEKTMSLNYSVTLFLQSVI
jgi:hypothetical protein